MPSTPRQHRYFHGNPRAKAREHCRLEDSAPRFARRGRLRILRGHQAIMQ